MARFARSRGHNRYQPYQARSFVTTSHLHKLLILTMDTPQLTRQVEAMRTMETSMNRRMDIQEREMRRDIRCLQRQLLRLQQPNRGNNMVRQDVGAKQQSYDDATCSTTSPDQGIATKEKPTECQQS